VKRKDLLVADVGVSLVLRVCSVRERSGIECHGSVPEEWNGSVPVFSWDQKIEWNGSIRCSVETIENRMERF
jgi:hypothetical protein